MIQDLESEAAVLGAMLLDESALYSVLGMLAESDFVKVGHRLIYRACRDLAYRGETPDLVTVQAQLAGARNLEAVGGPVALIELTGRVANVANVEAYCNVLVDLGRLRKLQAACVQVQAMIVAPGARASDVLEEAEGLIVDVGADAARAKVERVGEGWQPELKRMTDLKVAGLTAGTSTGFPGWDYNTGGMHPGRMIVIAARPSIGKSALALNMAVNQAKAGVPVGMVSLEMPKEELRARIVSSEANIDSMALTTGIPKEEHLKMYANTMDFLKDIPLYLNDDHEMHLSRLISTMRLMVRKMRVKVIYIDYLQLLTIQGFKGQRAEEVGKISRALKREAKKLGIAVVALCQVNRESEKTGKKERPRIHHLRESGSIEQDADQIALMDPDDNDASLITIWLDKNRGGPKGHFWLKFEAPYLRFITHNENRTPNQDEEEPAHDYRSRK